MLPHAWVCSSVLMRRERIRIRSHFALLVERGRTPHRSINLRGRLLVWVHNLIKRHRVLLIRPFYNRVCKQFALRARSAKTLLFMRVFTCQIISKHILRCCFLHWRFLFFPWTKCYSLFLSHVWQIRLPYINWHLFLAFPWQRKIPMWLMCF